jgi:hypothetical protein
VVLLQARICRNIVGAPEGLAMTRIFLAFLMTCAWAEAGYAVDRERQRAMTLLETMCGRYHAVGTTGERPA